MTVYFITRHPGAVAWAREEGIQVSQLIDHLDCLLYTSDAADE